MSRLCVAPIIEGHGESQAIRVLLERLWREVVEGESIRVLQPIRRPRDRFLQVVKRADLSLPESDLAHAIELAAGKLAQVIDPTPKLILILLDAEDDCARIPQMGPTIQRTAQRVRPDMDVAVVIANRMYETWFVAAAESLHDFWRDPRPSLPLPPQREQQGKGWVKRAFRDGTYSETVDQPRLTAAMDLRLCRRQSRSFDKLCRELEGRR